MRRKEPIPVNQDIAIVGMAGMFPGAPDLDAFWRNIIRKVNTIREVGKSRWDASRMFDPELRRRDRIYSKWGGFLDDIAFDPTEYGIVPNSMKYIEAMQMLALKIADMAFRDAGMERGNMPEKRTAVIFGSGGMHDRCLDYIFRTMLLHYLPRLDSIPDSTKTHIADAFCDLLPEWNEDSFPGMLTNVISGRVSNRFDLQGTNFTVDAACASSLAALDVGIAKLRSGQADTALVGAVDMTDNVMGFTAFAKTMVLSPQGKSRPFDDGADGIVISEGAAALVLKRLNDAEKNKDRIHAVIKGIGSSSDGRNRSLTAPHPQGQVIAIRRALRDSGIHDPGSIALIEAHGTGTVAGDRSEMEALDIVFGRNSHECAVGSVKSNIGHTKAVAGLAGIIKGILALENRILPPTMGVDRPNSRVDFKKSSFYLNTEPRPWFASDPGKPRRCGVSSFGFGGTNFHAVLEEYAGKNKTRPVTPVRDMQIFCFAADDRAGLMDRIKDFSGRLGNPDQTDCAALAHALYLENPIHGTSHRTSRLIVVACSVNELKGKLTRVLPQLESGGPGPEESGVYYGENSDASSHVCFLFPGQGSQRVNMLRDLLVAFPQCRAPFEQADTLLKGWFDRPLSDYIYPQPAFSGEERRRLKEILDDTSRAQPALAAADLAALELLKQFGIHPAFAAGHSFGEYIALCAAGVIKSPEAIRLAALRGKISQAASSENTGRMAALQADAATVASLLREAGTSAEAANFNAPSQTVIGGPGKDIDICLELARKKGVKAVGIPVTAAFHTSFMQPVADKLAAELEKVPFARAVLPVYSNTTGGPYPKTPRAIRNRLARHICRPLDFVSQVNNLYDAGACIFVEAGPGRVLCTLVDRILGEKPHTTLSLDYPGRSGTCHLAHMLAAAGAAGLPVNLSPWFGPSVPDLETVFKRAAQKADPPPMTWRICNGGAEPWHSAAQAPDRASAVQPVSGGGSMKKEVPRSSILKPRIKTKRKEQGVMHLKNSDHEPDNGVSDSLISRIQANLNHFIELQRDQQRLMDRFLDMQQQLMSVALNGNGAASEKHGPGNNQEKTPSGAALNRASLSGIPPAPVLPRLKPVFSEPASGVTEPHTPDAPSQVAPSAPTPMPAPVSEEPVSTQQFKADLLRIVSEQTGYPEDMLELDAHLEADLGIDSIKRVEIFSLLKDHHQLLESNDEELVLEELADLKSLRKIINWYDTNRARLMKEDAFDSKKA